MPKIYEVNYYVRGPMTTDLNILSFQSIDMFTSDVARPERLGFTLL